MVNTAYEEFVAAKATFNQAFGHTIDPAEVHPLLLPHQRDIVTWAVAGGRRAIFALYGLGKSLMQLETLRLTLAHHGGGRALIICPLSVRLEFAADAAKVGTEVTFVRRSEQVDGPGIYVTNYESVRDGRLDVNLFTAVSLDEASVLRSFGSKTYQEFLSAFADVPYRFVATATPSPNRHKELIHYAGFLGILDTGQALTRWFQRDSTKANNLTLYPHKAREFWLWLNTWACFVNSPADLGYDPAGYDLPPLELHWHTVDVDHDLAGEERDGQGLLYRGGALDLQAAAKEKRRTLADRVAELARIVDEHRDDGQIVLWCTLNDEQAAIERALDALGITYSSIYGSLDPDENEARLSAWKSRETHALIGKPVMLGQGMNLQQARRCVFVGIDHKWNDFGQALHRIQRFGQTRPCHAHVIYAESETEIRRDLLAKHARDKELRSTMTAIIREHGLDAASINEALQRSIGVERVSVSGETWEVANNDCVAEVRDHMAAASVGLIVTSIPFANHYEYTPAYEDFGHTDDNAHFWAQMDYLTPELLRVLQPGRIYACHVKDRINFGGQHGTGLPTVSPFHIEAVMHARKHGFDYLGMITVVTDVVRENNQTYRLSYSSMLKDGSVMGVGSPEYVLLFHKPQTDRSKGFADLPIVKGKDGYTLPRWQLDASAFWRSSGNRPLTAAELSALPMSDRLRLMKRESLECVYDHEAYVTLGDELDRSGVLPRTFTGLPVESADPWVWTDIDRMRTLNGEQVRRNVQMHVCLSEGSLVLTKGDGYKPIEQVNPGELVLTHKGRWRPVLARQATGKRPVVNLRAQGVPGAVMTPDHKVWCRDTSKFTDRSFRTAKRHEPRWVEAAETVGSYVNRKLAPVEMPGVADPDIWWVIGRWLADGHYHEARDGLHLSCHTDELPEVLDMLGDRASTPRQTGPNCAQILLRDSDRTLRNIAKRCGRGAVRKHLPPEAYTLPADQAKALLDGYLSGDGHYRADRRRWMASSVSKELLLGIAYLAQRVHSAAASVYPGRPERDGQIEGRDVHMSADWILSFDLPDDGRRKSPAVLDDGAWMKVRSADPAGEVETWNLRVAEDESFTAEGMVVKNCPLQLDIVERLIDRYSNPGDLVFDPFGGLGTVPLVAVRKDRRGRASELNAGYWTDSVRYLREEDEKRSMPDLFDLLDAEGAE